MPPAAPTPTSPGGIDDCIPRAQTPGRSPEKPRAPRAARCTELLTCSALEAQHRPRNSTKLTRGTFSRQRSRWPQAGQRERGHTRDSPRGSYLARRVAITARI